jgi:hypothetical protein
MIGGSLGGAIGGLFGSQDNSAAKKQAALLNEMRGLSSKDRARTNDFFAQARSVLGNYLQQGLASLDQGAAEAKSQFRGQRQDIVDSGRRASAVGTQAVGQRGLTNTTATQAVQRGVRSSTNRDLNNLAARQGSVLAGIGQNRAAFQSGMGGALSGLITQQSGANQMNTEMLMSILGNQQYTGKSGSGAGAAFGSAMGGLASMFAGNAMQNGGNLWSWGGGGGGSPAGWTGNLDRYKRQQSGYNWSSGAPQSGNPNG